MRSLPWRQGEKPKTNYGLPHEQLDQNPPPDIYAKLKDRAYDLRGEELKGQEIRAYEERASVSIGRSMGG